VELIQYAGSIRDCVEFFYENIFHRISGVSKAAVCCTCLFNFIIIHIFVHEVKTMCFLFSTTDTSAIVTNVFKTTVFLHKYRTPIVARKSGSLKQLKYILNILLRESTINGPIKTAHFLRYHIFAVTTDIIVRLSLKCSKITAENNKRNFFNQVLNMLCKVTGN